MTKERDYTSILMTYHTLHLVWGTSPGRGWYPRITLHSSVNQSFSYRSCQTTISLYNNWSILLVQFLQWKRRSPSGQLCGPSERLQKAWLQAAGWPGLTCQHWVLLPQQPSTDIAPQREGEGQTKEHQMDSYHVSHYAHADEKPPIHGCRLSTLQLCITMMGTLKAR